MAEEKKEEVKKEETPTQAGATAQTTTQQKSDVWKWVLIGCLVVVVITMLLFAGCSFFVYKKGKDVATEIQKEMESQVEQGQIPEDVLKEMQEQGFEMPQQGAPSAPQGQTPSVY